jgi:hypothetical protein
MSRITITAHLVEDTQRFRSFALPHLGLARAALAVEEGRSAPTSPTESSDVDAIPTESMTRALRRS